MKMLFNHDVEVDNLAVLAFINNFTDKAGYGPVLISPVQVHGILSGIRQDFPHNDGIEKASAFKKLARFILFFIDAEPISEPFPKELIGQDLAEIHNHQNAIIAFHIAVAALYGSVIHRGDCDVVLENPIQVSKHSYVDIICALTKTTPHDGFQLTSLLLEQLAYKTNPSCQYEPLLDL